MRLCRQSRRLRRVVNSSETTQMLWKMMICDVDPVAVRSAT